MSVLPAGYESLAFVESTGLQGINTGLYATTSDIIEIKGRFTKVNTQQFLLGTHDGRTYRKVACVMQNGTEWKFTGSAGALDELDDGSGWKYKGTPTMTADTDTHIFLFNHADASLTIDGVRYQLQTGGGAPSVRHMPLFANYHDSEIPVDRAYFQLEYAKFTQNGTLVRNYVAGLRESDNKIGVYDLVNNTFTISETGVDFIGPYKEIFATYLNNNVSYKTYINNQESYKTKLKL